MSTRSTAASDLSARMHRLADATPVTGDGVVEPLSDPWFDMSERTIVARAEGSELLDAPDVCHQRR